MKNGNLYRLVNGASWGLFLILIGVLFLGDSQGWLNNNGWSYFFIGLGAILTISGIVFYVAGQPNLWRATGRLFIGLAIMYIGIAFLYGFGDWWALALIPIGLGYLVRAFWRHSQSAVTTT